MARSLATVYVYIYIYIEIFTEKRNSFREQ